MLGERSARQCAPEDTVESRREPGRFKGSAREGSDDSAESAVKTVLSCDQPGYPDC